MSISLDLFLQNCKNNRDYSNNVYFENFKFYLNKINNSYRCIDFTIDLYSNFADVYISTGKDCTEIVKIIEKIIDYNLVVEYVNFTIYYDFFTKKYCKRY